MFKAAILTVLRKGEVIATTDTTRVSIAITIEGSRRAITDVVVVRRNRPSVGIPRLQVELRVLRI